MSDSRTCWSCSRGEKRIQRSEIGCAVNRNVRSVRARGGFPVPCAHRARRVCRREGGATRRGARFGSGEAHETGPRELAKARKATIVDVRARLQRAHETEWLTIRAISRAKFHPSLRPSRPRASASLSSYYDTVDNNHGCVPASSAPSRATANAEQRNSQTGSARSTAELPREPGIAPPSAQPLSYVVLSERGAYSGPKCENLVAKFKVVHWYPDSLSVITHSAKGRKARETTLF